MSPQISTALAEWGATPPVWLDDTLTARIESICKTVAEAANIHPAALFLSRRGPARVARTRQLVMAILRETTDLTLADIGQLFVGRDHGTVIFACKATRRRCAAFPAIKSIYQKITSKPTP